jgi:stage II sporulation protein E
VAFVEQEPFKAVAGVALRKKDGETVSGDAGTYFKRNDGKVYLLLCDGMGSGPAAGRESGLAIRLLEQFLQTGISAHHALLTLTSALALRGEDCGGFTTVDLLELDLFTGSGCLYKLGAAPTYVRQGENIRRLAGESLPAGLAGGGAEDVDRFPLTLEPGDCVLMVSDGVTGTGAEDWLLERLREFDGASPRALAARLITDSPQGATDDRTALVVKLERRG